MAPGPLLIGGLLIALGGVVLFWPRVGFLARIRQGAHLSRRILKEDTLKCLQKVESRKENAGVDALAGVLSVSRNRVAQLLEEMTREGLVVLEEETIRLTDRGREAALHIIRAHRLWEHYLSEETGYGEEEWHNRAEVREHMLSREATEELARSLGNPTYDPHGDPIPGSDGTGPIRSKGKALSAAAPGSRLLVSHVEDEPDVVYAQLIAEGVRPGTEIDLVENGPEKVRFWANGEIHTLAPIVARNVTVVEAVPAESDTLAGTLPLSSLGLGEEGVVAGIAGSCRGSERRRMLDLGLVPGTRVVAEMRSPGGDPTGYRIRETLIALREKQAGQVRIRSSRQRSSSSE